MSATELENWNINCMSGTDLVEDHDINLSDQEGDKLQNLIPIQLKIIQSIRNRLSSDGLAARIGTPF